MGRQWDEIATERCVHHSPTQFAREMLKAQEKSPAQRASHVKFDADVKFVRRCQRFWCRQRPGKTRVLVPCARAAPSRSRALRTLCSLRPGCVCCGFMGIVSPQRIQRANRTLTTDNRCTEIAKQFAAESTQIKTANYCSFEPRDGSPLPPHSKPASGQLCRTDHLPIPDPSLVFGMHPRCPGCTSGPLVFGMYPWYLGYLCILYASNTPLEFLVHL